MIYQTTVSWLAFVANENAISKLYIYRTKDFKPLKLPSFPIGQIYGLSFNDDNNRIAMTLNSSRSPGDVYVLNIKNKKLTLFIEHIFAIEDFDLAYQSLDSRKISGKILIKIK